MDKKARNKVLGIGIFLGLIFLFWTFLARTPGGQRVASQLQQAFPGLSLPAPTPIDTPDITIGVPAGGTGPSGYMPYPIPTGGSGCGCKVSLCEGENSPQVKKAPNWTNAMLSDSFGVSFGSNGGVGLNYAGMTPTQVYGVWI